MARRVVRVAVDGFALSDGSELRGMGRVLRSLLDGLVAERDLELVALVAPGAGVPDGAEAQRLDRHPMRPRLAHLEHELRLSGDLRRSRADVIWAPGSHPPRRAPAPLVQTVHDLTPLAFPHPSTAHEARRWRRSARRVRRARTVVAVSRSSADQAIRLLGLDPRRVEVVANGVDPAFSPGPSPEAGEPYLLYVGAWGAHKGFDEAMAVVAALAELGYPHPLVIAGPQDDWMAARVAEHVRAAARPDRIEILGWVDNLVDLYRGAAALLFTSRAEGFGLPLVEAMACGTPVVAFANTSIPEVVGDAGRLVPDGDVEAFVAAVRSIIDTPSLADQLREAGLARAADFRWAAAVAQYHDILVAAGSVG